jgi:hypothetical protein
VEPDEVLAKNFALVVNVPEHHVLSFLKSRSASDTHKLSSVLRQMPGTDWSTSKPLGHQFKEAPEQVGKADCGHVRSFTHQGQKTNFQTSYEGFFSPSGKFAGQTPEQAFEGVLRNDYAQHFAKWRKDAREDQVRVLADAVRALRYFNSGEKPPTQYDMVHTHFPDHRPEALVEKKNSRNVSAIPLGSIYSQSEEEAHIARKSQEKHQEHLLSATRRQDAWRKKSLTAEDQLKMNVCTYSEVADSTIHKTLKVTAGSTPKSSCQEAWHSKVHSPLEVARHGHSFIKPGETDWNMGGIAAHGSTCSIHCLRDPKLFPSGGSANRSRLVPSKMARNADETARLASSKSSPSF